MSVIEIAVCFRTVADADDTPQESLTSEELTEILKDNVAGIEP